MSWSHCHRWYSWPTYFLGQYSLNIPTNGIQTNYASLCARGQTHRQCLYSVHHHLPIKSSEVKDAARHGSSKIQATQEANAAKYFVYIYPLFESFSDINSNKQTNMSRKKYVAGQAVCPLIFNHYATISKDHNKYPMSNAKWCTFCERT